MNIRKWFKRKSNTELFIDLLISNGFVIAENDKLIHGTRYIRAFKDTDAKYIDGIRCIRCDVYDTDSVVLSVVLHSDTFSEYYVFDNQIYTDDGDNKIMSIYCGPILEYSTMRDIYMSSVGFILDGSTYSLSKIIGRFPSIKLDEIVEFKRGYYNYTSYTNAVYEGIEKTSTP